MYTGMLDVTRGGRARFKSQEAKGKDFEGYTAGQLGVSDEAAKRLGLDATKRYKDEQAFKDELKQSAVGRASGLKAGESRESTQVDQKKVSEAFMKYLENQTKAQEAQTKAFDAIAKKL
jgi:hypothetical protein